ncbi:hypothetical protein [Streptomyces sp. SS]|uniref:hypothetical protein n=1 Tax=Streptomyces sp. SS TaxID=260742 RepID=UPI000303A772|nr:hypothetical protein [Streptomyces sp. SS]
MTMYGKLARVLAATALATAGLVGYAGSAAAGTNGQQVTVSTRWSDQIRMCGRNQYDQESCTGWIASPNLWTPVPGWWWKGEVFIEGWRHDTGESYYGYCDVPPEQASDWTECHLWGTL